MKIRVILTSLILLGFLFCLINHGQARMDPWWEDRYPGEHPWQDLECPAIDDTISLEMSSGIVIVVTPTKLLVIRAYQIKSGFETTRQAPKKMQFRYPAKKGND